MNCIIIKDDFFRISSQKMNGRRHWEDHPYQQNDGLIPQTRDPQKDGPSIYSLKEDNIARLKRD